jgi:tetratricopeptide (TPR) repeat protein
MRCTLAALLLFAVPHLASAQNLHGVPDPAPDPSDAVWVHIVDPELQLPARSAAAPINVEVLQIPDKARQELASARAALQKGDMQRAAQRSEKAVAIAPQSAPVRNTLGVMYMNSKDYGKALAAFEAALFLNPNYHLAANNIVVVLAVQHRWTEAEPAARRALSMQPDSVSSQYLLGSILVVQEHNFEEATPLLENAKDKYPRARLFLAQVAFEEGHTQRAVDELQQYLRCPSVLEREVARFWLTQLQNQEAAKVHEIPPTGGAQL